MEDLTTTPSIESILTNLIVINFSKCHKTYCILFINEYMCFFPSVWYDLFEINLPKQYMFVVFDRIPELKSLHHQENNNLSK